MATGKLFYVTLSAYPLFQLLIWWIYHISFALRGVQTTITKPYLDSLYDNRRSYEGGGGAGSVTPLQKVSKIPDLGEFPGEIIQKHCHFYLKQWRSGDWFQFTIAPPKNIVVLSFWHSKLNCTKKTQREFELFAILLVFVNNNVSLYYSKKQQLSFYAISAIWTTQQHYYTNKLPVAGSIVKDAKLSRCWT